MEWQTGRELSGVAAIDKYTSYGAELFKTFCFADDTPLRTPDGSKLIRDFRKGDAILAALDSDPLAPVGVQFIEEIFSNHSPILNLHAGGRIIRTTAEHPIFAWGRGWVPAGSLRRGDRLRSDNGNIVLVEGIAYSGEEANVYNLKVREFHTYFVGADDWALPGQCGTKPASAFGGVTPGIL